MDNKYFVSAISPSLSQIAIFDNYTDANYYVINVDTEEISHIIAHQPSWSGCCFVSSDETLLVIGCMKGIINIWDIKTKTIKYQFRSLFSKDINILQEVNDYIIITENFNVEIYKLDELGLSVIKELSK